MKQPLLIYVSQVSPSFDYDMNVSTSKEAYTLKHFTDGMIIGQADSGRLEPINSDMGIAGIHWMSNTRQLLTGGGDSSVKLWDIWENGEMVRSYDTSSNVTSLAVDEDSMVICAGVSGSQGYVHVFTGAQL